MTERGLSDRFSFEYEGLKYKMNKLKKRFSDVKMLTRFEQSVFRHFIPAIEQWNFAGVIIKYLFLHMECPDDDDDDADDELHFRFADTPCRFGKMEFAMYTGLRFGPLGDVGHESRCLADGMYLKKHGRPITVKVLEAAMELEQNAEVVYRLGLVYFIYVILNGHRKSSGIPDEYFYSVEDLDRVAVYPWGQLLWENFIEMSQIYYELIKQNNEKRITVDCLLGVLQYWAYDTLPDLVVKGAYATRRNNSVPWMLRWTCAHVAPRAKRMSRCLIDEPMVVGYLELGVDDVKLLRGIGFTEEEIIAKAVVKIPEKRVKKKVIFDMNRNLTWMWMQGEALPSLNLRIPPSAIPRGSALKEGVPPGPILEVTTSPEKAAPKKGRKIAKTVSRAPK